MFSLELIIKLITKKDWRLECLYTEFYISDFIFIEERFIDFENKHANMFC